MVRAAPSRVHTTELRAALKQVRRSAPHAGKQRRLPETQEGRDPGPSLISGAQLLQLSPHEGACVWGLRESSVVELTLAVKGVRGAHSSREQSVATSEFARERRKSSAHPSEVTCRKPRPCSPEWHCHSRSPHWPAGAPCPLCTCHGRLLQDYPARSTVQSRVQQNKGAAPRAPRFPGGRRGWPCCEF